GGLEAVLNSVLVHGARVAIGGSPRFVSETAEVVRRVGGQPTGEVAADCQWLVVPLIDPFNCTLVPVREVAAHAHASGARIIVEATLGLGTCELRVDDWAIDVCVAGTDYALGAPAGMSLISYTPAV